MKEMLSIYRDRLINLSTKNRTLLLKKLYRKIGFDLKNLEKINGSNFSHRLLELLAKRYNGKMKILSTPKSEDEYRFYESLKSIYREANNIQKEKGSYDLYIGYPFVEGKFKDGTIVKAPLLLFPIKLKIENEEVFLSHVEDEYISINKTFILGFKKYNEIKLKDFELEFEKLKSVDILSWILEYMSQNGIFIDRESEGDEIEYFKEFKKDTEDSYESGDLVVKNNLVIGQFPNSTSSIYDDYGAIIAKDENNNLIKNLIENYSLNEDTKRVKKQKRLILKKEDQENYFVTELDYSQESAIISSEDTDELVIYGPPGTGKSQVIVNLIVDNLAKGKKVLMVSQKKAAIDVVYNRLMKIGLDSRVANVELSNADRQKVFSKIKSTLESGEDYFDYKYDVDFKKTSKSLLKEKEKLEELSIHLNKKTDFGLTLNQLYAKSVNEYEYFIEELNDDFHKYKHINSEDLEKIIKNLERVIKVSKYDKYNLIESNRKSFADFQEIEKERIINIVDRVKKYTYEYMEIKSKNSSIEEMESTILEYDINTVRIMYLFNDTVELLSNGNVTIKDINSRNLNILTKLNNIVKANKFWKINYWKSRFELKKRINGYNLDDITAYIDEIDELNKHIEAIKEYFDIEDVLNTNNKEELIQLIKSKIKYIECINKPIIEARLLEKYFEDSFLYNISKSILKNGNWESALDDIKNMVKISFERMKTQDHFKSKLTVEEKMILNYAKDKYDRDNAEDFSKAIRNTIYLKHIEVMEMSSREVLDSFDKPENIKSRIDRLIIEKRKIVPDIIKNKLNNKIKDREQYSNIRYESEKKRDKMSLRRFVHSFYDEGLLDLLPCWLVTPEVVSTVFPLKEGIFDLVIFDEASQMFIENSIPSIYRAKSVVIAGDDKQLQPNDLYKIKVDDSLDEYKEEYESKMNIEAKSLLELAKYKYESITLNYHYRSIYEELINFSNYAFYGGKIEVVPNIKSCSDFSPIERIKVDGRWIDRKNVKEAERVVDLVKEILKTREDDETLGIITFNISQKDCIEELLERESQVDIEFGALYRSELERTDGNEYRGIFVKNIENVQGDERDIIIFSVGYAQNEEGRVVRNFGSLTMKYGENRLNVAISRAKNKIYLVTSIEPEELGYVDDLSRGAILLKKYLQYVKAVSDNDREEVRHILYSLDTIEKTNSEIIHFDSPFEEEVYERLVREGVKVHTQVGSASYRIDMAIYDEKESKYILGIECDGATYHSSKSARERDAYRQRFLESRGWIIHRIWSRDWWKNRDIEIEKIKLRIKELK